MDAAVSSGAEVVLAIHSILGAVSELQCHLDEVSDGYCDDINNNQLCGWDGGDCCACTCRDTHAYIAACGVGDWWWAPDNQITSMGFPRCKQVLMAAA